jgi:hypothetical protein
MNEQVYNLPEAVNEVEQKPAIQSRLKNRHWRLQKALDILLNYLLELENYNQNASEAQEKDEKNLFI